jgi:hypothetical protein
LGGRSAAALRRPGPPDRPHWPSSRTHFVGWRGNAPCPGWFPRCECPPRPTTGPKFLPRTSRPPPEPPRFRCLTRSPCRTKLCRDRAKIHHSPRARARPRWPGRLRRGSTTALRQ